MTDLDIADSPRERSKNEATTGPMNFAIDSRRVLIIVFVACVSAEILFFILDLVINHQRGSEIRAIRRIFNTAREGSLPSWFGVIQTFVIGVIGLINFILVSKIDASNRRRIGWLLLAFAFIYMSADDDAKIHERLGTASQSFEFMSGALSAYPSYAWQVVVGPLFAALGLFILYFLWHELVQPIERYAVVAAIGVLAFAVFLDYLEGLDDGYRLLLDNTDWSKRAVEHFSKSIEEVMEMFGMTIFLIVFLRHSMRLGSSVSIEFY
jgi:hypothetical protein